MVYRGSVIEIYQDSIIVMTEDCIFERIKKSAGLEKGMEVYFEERDIIRNSTVSIKNISMVAAAVFLFIITSLYGIGIWNTNYRTVALLSIDINPSVEMEINKKNNIIRVSALNEDASKLPLNNLKNKPVADAMVELVEMAGEKGYIKENEENYVLVTSVELKNPQENDKVLEELLMEGKNKIETVSSKQGQQIQVVTMKSDKETLNKAKKENISVGKMEIYEETKDKNKNENDKEIKKLKDKKVKDLIKSVEKTKGNNGKSDVKQKPEKEDRKDKGNNNGKKSNENKSNDNKLNDKNDNKEKDNKEKEKKEKIDNHGNAKQNTDIKEQKHQQQQQNKKETKDNSKDKTKDKKEKKP